MKVAPVGRHTARNDGTKTHVESHSCIRIQKGKKVGPVV